MTGARIDLHNHSTASDGRLTPAQLVEMAKNRGLAAIALTDHDTVAGLAMFHEAGKKRGIETISGVEVSADFEKGTMHIIGLFVDSKNQEFRAFLKCLADGRKVRNPQIIQKLNDLGMKLTMREVETEAGMADNGPGSGAIDKCVGRPHIAAVMIRKGYVANKQEAFDKFLAKGKPAYMPRFVATPAESIRQIHNAEGLAILAHPFYLKAEDDAELESIIADLKKKGLDGMEVYYSTHTPEQKALAARIATDLNLIVSGGSDFHGEEGRSGHRVDMGTGINGTLSIPYEILENLKAKRMKRS
ncbi:MAG: PHP domain-containing protein [Planctomycetota bacterium]